MERVEGCGRKDGGWVGWDRYGGWEDGKDGGWWIGRIGVGRTQDGGWRMGGWRMGGRRMVVGDEGEDGGWRMEGVEGMEEGRHQ